MTITTRQGNRIITPQKECGDFRDIINDEVRNTAIFTRYELINKWISYMKRNNIINGSIEKSAYNPEILQHLSFLLSLIFQSNKRNLDMADVNYIEEMSNSIDAPFDIMFDLDNEESDGYGKVLILGAGKYEGFFMYMDPLHSQIGREVPPTITFGFSNNPREFTRAFYDSNDSNVMTEAISNQVNNTRDRVVSVFASSDSANGFNWERF